MAKETKMVEAVLENPAKPPLAADETRSKLQTRLQIECPVASQTVKVIKLWGDYYRANYWAEKPNTKLLLDGGTTVVANSRFLRAQMTETGLDFHDLTR